MTVFLFTVVNHVSIKDENFMTMNLLSKEYGELKPASQFIHPCMAMP